MPPSVLPSEGATPAPEDRRSALASAWQGLDRFKRSWLSIMVLKAGIGLGQVAALIVLLVLATVLPSPLNPHQTQSTPSAACPRPQLFQAWMAVQICRLTVCWAVSCWICTRNRRADVRAAAEDPDLEAGSSTAPIRPARDAVAIPPLPELQASSSTSSTASTSTLAVSTTTPSPCAELHITPMTTSQTGHSSSSLGSSLTLHESKENTPAAAALPPLAAGLAVPTDPETLRLAREAHEAEALPTSGLASIVDKWANTISKSLGLISIVLFILGNVLLFRPLPTHAATCYHAAPMLWWGVMTVTGVGWFLFFQMFVVMFVVGIGGHAVVILLRKVGILKAPPEPAPPRPPQPDPLTPTELAQVEVVCYVPPSSSDCAHPPLASRLPHRPLVLDEDQTTCAICQEAFVPPADLERTIIFVAAPLRLLPCAHVYHTGCIDAWLTRGGGNCPFCNRDVREMLRMKEQEKAGGLGEGTAGKKRR